MAIESTHELVFDGDRVTKTYRHWTRGEPRREWEALLLMHHLQPGLAPEPLQQALDADPPRIVMSRLEGVSLADTGVVSQRQSTALIGALDRLHAGVPATRLADLPLRHWHPAEAVSELRTWAADVHDVGGDDDARSALHHARRWLQSSDPDALSSTEGAPVFTHADGNLSNFVWSDGAGTAHIVDFEDAGRSDRAYELADLTEHISIWVDHALDTDRFVQQLGLDARETSRFGHCRRLWATFWLLMLLPDGPAHGRNPAGTLGRQATRLLAVL